MHQDRNSQPTPCYTFNALGWQPKVPERRQGISGCHFKAPSESTGRWFGNGKHAIRQLRVLVNKDASFLEALIYFLIKPQFEEIWRPQAWRRWHWPPSSPPLGVGRHALLSSRGPGGAPLPRWSGLEPHLASCPSRRGLSWWPNVPQPCGVPIASHTQKESL